METFQSIKTIEKENAISQSVDTSIMNSAISEEVEKFDNNYSDKKIKELTNEFDSITIDEDILKSVTITQDNVMTNTQVSFRTKLFIACSIAITSLLLFLAIYNIFRINAMSSGIELLQNNIATETNIYNSLQNDVNNMNDTTSITAELNNMGYYEISDSDIVYVEVPAETPVQVLSGSTNWFDSICNFVSSIFGG